MAEDKVYAMTKVIGSSSESYDKAIENAVSKISEHVEVQWFNVIEHRGHVVKGAVKHHQVVIEFGCAPETFK